MDPREMETLVQRLVQNPHDQDTITHAHQAGQTDPKSYAMLLEKVGTATSDPAFACHWLTEAANVWSTTLGDAHRAARALMIAIDRDPTQATPAERLAELYRDKGDSKALVALLERRAKALAPLAAQDPGLHAQVAAIHEELGQLWQTPPLAQPKKAIENYRRAVEYDPASQYSIYALRELYKAAGQWSEAVPYFEMEQNLVDDVERKVALYQDEGEVRKSALDFVGAAAAFRRARELDGGQDPTLKQQLGTAILERVQAGQKVPEAELREGAELFVELAEEYPGEHGLSYSMCALELVPTHDRAVQLAMYYGDQLNRSAEVAPRAAAYLKASPQGALASEARKLVSESMEAGGDDSMLDALAPPPGAGASERVLALVEVAQTLARKAKKNDAAAKFREVLAIEPANLEAIGFLEPFLRQTRKYPDLREILLAAGRDENADIDQRQSWLREVAGLCETQLRDIDGAIVALKELIVIDVDDEPARGALKRLLEKQSRWDELATLMADEAEQTLDTEARISLEKALAKLHEQKRKDPIATGEAWARIAALASGDEEAITTAVRYFEKSERPDLAIQVIAENIEAISNEAQRVALLEKLGQLRETKGDALSAGEAFAEAAALLKSAALWESAERCFVAAEAWDQAATAVDERAQLTELTHDRAVLFATEAGYLAQAGDDSSAVLRLEQATELDPANDGYAAALEERYQSAERNEDLAGFLLRRAEKLTDRSLRSALRKRAATLQREALGNPEAARHTLQELLKDGDDLEALATLADDAEARGEFKEAVELLASLEKASQGPEQHATVLLRQGALIAAGLDDLKGAIAVYERLLQEFEPKHDEALGRIAELYERLAEPKGVAEALERRLLVLDDRAEKLKVAEKLAQLYDQTLDDAAAAVRALDLVRELDPENFEAVGRLAELCEKLEDWPRVAKHLAELIEVEGDEEEASRMTRRLAEILHEKVKKSDEALAALMQVADAGDEACREEYVRLGDTLGWKGVVATKLVEWYLEAPASPARNASLRGAFERFVEVERDADAASVAKELARTRGADPEIAKSLEQIAVKLKDLDALSIAHDLLVQELSGPSRADEMVRQAEVLAEAGVEAAEATKHGEQALTSVPPGEVEPLLRRLAKLSGSVPRIIEIYERQVTRCKAPSDKLAALGRAASIAASHGAYDKARQFFDVALGGAVQEETLNALEAVARTSDAEQKSEKLRRTLAEALANGGQGSRDGGRTRGMLLGRAAELAYRELKDVEQAFAWLGDAIVTHVDDEPLAALERLADEVGELKRAESVLNRALEEVFDGPLVRKLLARRASVRREKLGDPQGAAADLKRLHDLSPADTAVMEQLSQLYVELEDYRGMVQLYEDQILRGKEPAARAELARKVAHLWEEKLSDPREAADAWRRVLRMKAQDPEAAEGLERAKANMLKRTSSEPPEEKPVAAKVEPVAPTGTTDKAGDKPERLSKPKAASKSSQTAAEAPPADGARSAPTPLEPGLSAEAASEGQPAEAPTAPPVDASTMAVPKEPADEAASDGPSEKEPKGEADRTVAAPLELPSTSEASSPRVSPVPPPLPASALSDAVNAASPTEHPLTNGVGAAHSEVVDLDAEDPGRASAPPPSSSPGHKGPPPKPSARKGGAAPPPPPPSRTGAPAPSSAPGSLKPPPPPTGGPRPAPPPPPPVGTARPAPPPPPGTRDAGKQPPHSGPGQPPPTRPDATTAGAPPATEARPPSTPDDDALTVDEDELIDDGLT